MIDKYGRNINYARISLTEKCNLRCVYCMPDDVSFNEYENTLSLNDYKFIINGLSQIGITKIRFTGGEPLLYEGLSEIIRYTYEECNIKDVAITTNGIGLYDMAYELYESGLRTVNISLDSLKEYKYKSITRNGDIKEVLKSISRCLELGMKVKINCVLISGFNENEIPDFILMTKFNNIDVRFIELMPLGEASKIYRNGYVNIQDVISQIDGLYKIESSENSTAKYYKLEDSMGRVGIITPMSCSFCSECNRIRITQNGTIKLCLHSEEEYDIKYYLNKPLIFREVLKEIILDKPERHYLNENKVSDTKRSMYQIGV